MNQYCSVVVALCPERPEPHALRWGWGFGEAASRNLHGWPNARLFRCCGILEQADVLFCPFNPHHRQALS